jgi:phage terminase small subunit
MPVGLTLKQERFVHEIATAPSAAEAARRAGYSKRSAKQRAHEVVTNRDLAPVIEEVRQQVLRATDVTSEEVLTGLLKEARGLGADTSSAARTRAYELLGKNLGIIGEKVSITIDSPRLVAAMGRITARYITDPEQYRAWAAEIDAACR